jgi:hypothetical protein
MAEVISLAEVRSARAARVAGRLREARSAGPERRVAPLRAEDADAEPDWRLSQRGNWWARADGVHVVICQSRGGKWRLCVTTDEGGARWERASWPSVAAAKAAAARRLDRAAQAQAECRA